MAGCLLGNGASRLHGAREACLDQSIIIHQARQSSAEIHIVGGILGAIKIQILYQSSRIRCKLHAFQGLNGSQGLRRLPHIRNLQLLSGHHRTDRGRLIAVDDHKLLGGIFVLPALIPLFITFSQEIVI